MGIQILVLCLCAVSVLAKNGRNCLSPSCCQNVGVYYIFGTFPGNTSTSDIVTFYADGTLTTVSATASGIPMLSTIPQSYSISKGVWKCRNANTIDIKGFFFVYPAQNVPGALLSFTVVWNSIGGGRVSGTFTGNLYDLVSVRNQNKSTWVKLAGPLTLNFQGYKALDACADCN